MQSVLCTHTDLSLSYQIALANTDDAKNSSVRRQLNPSCKKRGIHVRHRLTQAARCRVYNVWKPAVVLRYINFHARKRISITRPCKPSACVQVLAQSLADH